MGESDHEQGLDTGGAGSSRAPPGFGAFTGPLPGSEPRDSRWNGGPRFPNPGAAQAGVAARARVSGIPPLSTAFTSANDMLHWLQRFDGIWGHMGDYDFLTGLFLAERRDSLGRLLATYDLGPAGPLHPMSRYVPSQSGEDIFERFMHDGVHWEEEWHDRLPPAVELVTHHVRVLQVQEDWLTQAREATYQAYESQLRFIRDMRHRGELRLRSMPGHPGYWGLTGLRDVCGLAPYFVNPETNRAGTEAAPAQEARVADDSVEAAQTRRRVETAEKSSGKLILKHVR